MQTNGAKSLQRRDVFQKREQHQNDMKRRKKKKKKTATTLTTLKKYTFAPPTAHAFAYTTRQKEQLCKYFRTHNELTQRQARQSFELCRWEII